MCTLDEEDLEEMNLSSLHHKEEKIRRLSALNAKGGESE
jgi:hypothetical protein